MAKAQPAAKKKPRARKRNQLGRYVNKDITWRLFIHIPVGMAAVAMGLVSPVLGVGLGAYFGLYELAQDWRKKDCGYKDIAGFAWGLGIAGVALGVIAYLDLCPGVMSRFPLF
jgi:hypothetical protein